LIRFLNGVAVERARPLAAAAPPFLPKVIKTLPSGLNLMT